LPQTDDYVKLKFESEEHKYYHFNGRMGSIISYDDGKYVVELEHKYKEKDEKNSYRRLKDLKKENIEVMPFKPQDPVQSQGENFHVQTYDEEKEHYIVRYMRDLPEGWEEHYDAESGRTFYVDTTTGSSQWERPERQVKQEHVKAEHLIKLKDMYR